MNLGLNPKRNRFGWYDALDTTLSQDITAYALSHDKMLNPKRKP